METATKMVHEHGKCYKNERKWHAITPLSAPYTTAYFY